MVCLVYDMGRCRDLVNRVINIRALHSASV